MKAWLITSAGKIFCFPESNSNSLSVQFRTSGVCFHFTFNNYILVYNKY